LPAPLRREMQAVLDAMQSDKTNELEKVSLERLADIGPDLLATIKATAQDNMAAISSNHNGHDAGNYADAHSNDSKMKPAFLQYDSRSPSALQLEQEWAQLAWDHSKATSVIDKLRYQPVTDVDILYTQQEAQQMTVYFGVAQALSTFLQATLERVQQNEANRALQRDNGALRRSHEHNHQQYRAHLDKSLFSNAGIKLRNNTAIGYLYQVGLPFVSTSDGRRFATQIELSHHLDALFKRNKVEKSMARTEERSWTLADAVWTRLESEAAAQLAASAMTNGTDALHGQNTEQPEDVFPADETRSRCVICGINFKMFFDNDNGMYMYKNCCEKSVENDEAAEEQTSLMLVHVTCWKALGSPSLLTMDQALLTNRE
jgi:pre-mRNA cleavage complex 2 protein Pcf11